MEWTRLNDLRKQYLDFFVGKGHYLLESAPLVPEEDKSLLLINSGMAPLKKYFLGQAKLPGNRATSCQKCIRTPDIERVGKTSRHGTFFEMLGNFSFADYFKREAIKWAYELTTEVWKMPPEKLYMSVFEEDDEAYDIWTKEVGVPHEHMVRLGREDNFWEIGAGPCGPCSEIYYDRGEKYGCKQEGCAPGCDCDRFVEFWNLVFTQFISDSNGNYEKMAHGNIDTGMGLERVACIMQDVDNLFEVDTVRNIIGHVGDVAGISYHADETADVSLRVIADHLRGTVFMIGDGIVPSNEGRGYVLRRLLRRAARHGRLLGIERPFLFETADTVIDENISAYPNLGESRSYIKRIVKAEEERFLKTIDQGFSMLMEIVEAAIEKGQSLIEGEPVFKLYDTFGFPLDLTREIIEERGLSVDVVVFDRLMELQRTRAREERKAREEIGWEDDFFTGLDFGPTEFAGYETLRCHSILLCIVSGNEQVEEACEGDKVTLILDRTPFYAEGGGQVGDAGFIRTGQSLVRVDNCKAGSEGFYLHLGEVLNGNVRVGDAVEAEVGSERRSATERNHTSVHLLQQALREILGDHVRQAGSYVDSERSRFDFSHFEAVSVQELKMVEEIVNKKILSGLTVETSVMPVGEARELGAIAIFGEKYGETVRVVSVQDFSSEFCGGTHVSNTSGIGLFKILSESSVAAGIRRIEATTGLGVMDYIYKQQEIISEAATAFKLNNFTELGKRALSVVELLRGYEKQIRELKRLDVRSSVSEALSSFTDIDGIKVRAARLTGLDHAALRSAADNFKGSIPESVTVIAAVTEGKVSFVAACGKKAIESGLSAGEIIKTVAALAGGSGGGKPEMAMAGAKDESKVDEAIAAVPDIVKNMLAGKGN